MELQDDVRYLDHDEMSDNDEILLGRNRRGIKEKNSQRSISSSRQRDQNSANNKKKQQTIKVQTIRSMAPHPATSIVSSTNVSNGMPPSIATSSATVTEDLAKKFQDELGDDQDWWKRLMREKAEREKRIYEALNL
jgi:hypothetical protein